MRHLILGIATIASLLGCAKVKTTYPKNTVTVQNCTVETVDGSANITCPDGTTIVLPPTVLIQTVEVPVLVEVPTECHPNNGNHYGQDEDHHGGHND